LRLAVGGRCGQGIGFFRFHRHGGQAFDGVGQVADHRVGVDVHREVDRAVPGERLRDLRVNAGPCEVADEGVAKAVEVGASAGRVRRIGVRLRPSRQFDGDCRFV
jgi:hypothetical protein